MFCGILFNPLKQFEVGNSISWLLNTKILSHLVHTYSIPEVIGMVNHWTTAVYILLMLGSVQGPINTASAVSAESLLKKSKYFVSINTVILDQ